jgi:hypothetical protein
VRPELVSDPAIFPSSEAVNEYFFFAPIDQDIMHLITKLWLDFKAGR